METYFYDSRMTIFEQIYENKRGEKRTDIEQGFGRALKTLLPRNIFSISRLRASGVFRRLLSAHKNELDIT